MDYRKVTVPYIGNQEIKKKAESFQTKYWDKKLPVDIEKVIDVNLEINIIPLPGLENICNTNALITSDWNSLYVDQDLFEDERRYNRLRFSLAHEIGHYILHKNFYTNLEIKSFEGFYNFINLMPNEQYGFLETQANKFANYLLIPRNLVGKMLEKEIEKTDKLDIDDFDKALLKSYIASSLSKDFGVSQNTMEIALNEYEF